MKKLLIPFLLGLGALTAQAYSLYTPAGTVDVGISNIEGQKASYRVQVADIVPAATATDVFTLCGSATKVIRVNRIQVTADSTAPAVIDFYVFKRSAANTGGTSTAPTISKFDSADGTATATVALYSANPSALGAGALFTGDHYALPAAASTGYPGMPWIEDFGIRNNRATVLRGVSQCLSFSLNGQAIPLGFGLYFGIEWTEE